jgi:Family of unknown function (DUF6335)
MGTKKRRRLPVDRRTTPSPGLRDRRARPRFSSATAVAAEALRTGVVPAVRRGRRTEIPHEDDTLRMGDPDESALNNEYSGEDTPGGSSPTPDQNNVDEIGRAYGLQEEDAAALRSGAEVLARRDRHRPELRPPRRRRV